MRHAGSSVHPSALATTKLVSFTFVPIGIVTVFLGPLLPILSAQWSLNYLQAGSLFTAQFLGSTIAVSLSGAVISRWGFRFAVQAGLLAMALGVGGLPFSSRPVGLICVAGYGIGLGLAIPAINLLVAALNADHRSAALNRLNFWWSVGAVACPFLVAASAKANQTKIFLVAVAVVLLVLVLRIARLPSFMEPSDPEPALSRQQHRIVSGVGWKWRSGAILAALFFLYVGTENAFGGWIASYARSLGTASPALSAMTPSFFYAALMAGRWIAPGVLRRMEEIPAARVGLLVAGVGMAALVLSPTISPVLSSVAVAGLGLALVYPITISRLSLEFGTAASRAGSVMFTMSNLGGASLPWLVGYYSHKFNSLKVGLVVPLVATGTMLILYLYERMPVRARSANA